MPISLTVTNNQDGTATAEIGGTAGAANTIYVAKWAGWSSLGDIEQPPVPGAWEEAGDRSGDGEIVLALHAGFYFAYLLSDGASGVPVGFRVTEGSTSIWERCVDEIHARLLTLALLPDGQVERQLEPPGDDRSKPLPRIVVSPLEREKHDPAKGTNLKDEIVYPVAVVLLGKGNRGRGDEAQSRSAWLLWRERIAGEFRNQRLAVEPVYHADVEFREAVTPNAWFDANLVQGAIIVHCHAYQTRG